MAKTRIAVFDAGPFIHLSEIERIKLLNIFEKIFTTKEILEECTNLLKILIKIKNITKIDLKPESKDFAKYLINKYSIDLGEATGIALCKQEKVKLFFTDDLNARQTATILGFEPHGTLAIIMSSLREGLIDKKETKIIIEKLYKESTLFITVDLIEWILNEVEKF